MDEARNIVALIPGYQEGPRIAAVVAGARLFLPVVVVDDGSTDDTGAIAESYGPPVLAIRQENGGMAASRNRAIQEATGDFFAFLDADDRFRPEKLERQLAVFRDEPELDVVYGHVTEFVSPELDAAAIELLRPPRADSPWPTPNLMLVRRESFFRVGLFSTELKVGIGVDWHARSIEAGLRSTVPPVVVLDRRLHAENNGIRQRQLKPQYLHVLKASLDRRRG
jgi:glycosyltransferase involved in cell wall biosynthesis